MPQKNILKQFLDSKLAWDLVQGAVYNRVIWDAAGPAVREIIDQTPMPRDDARGLDVGSGPGFATIYAAKKFPSGTIIGVDYSPQQVRWAKRLLARERAPNCSFRIGDAMALPFDDETFDIVISLASIKHWPDPVRGLREISRVLKPGCSAHVGEADRDCNPGDLDSFAKAFTDRWWINKPLVRGFLKSTVFGKSYNCGEMEGFAREAGFTDVRVTQVPGRPFLRMDLKKEEKEKITTETRKKTEARKKSGK